MMYINKIATGGLTFSSVNNAYLPKQKLKYVEPINSRGAGAAREWPSGHRIHSRNRRSKFDSLWEIMKNVMS
jgi:hypothetical protein